MILKINLINKMIGIIEKLIGKNKTLLELVSISKEVINIISIGNEIEKYLVNDIKEEIFNKLSSHLTTLYGKRRNDGGNSKDNKDLENLITDINKLLTRYNNIKVYKISELKKLKNGFISDLKKVFDKNSFGIKYDPIIDIFESKETFISNILQTLKNQSEDDNDSLNIKQYDFKKILNYYIKSKLNLEKALVEKNKFSTDLEKYSNDVNSYRNKIERILMEKGNILDEKEEKNKEIEQYKLTIQSLKKEIGEKNNNIGKLELIIKSLKDNGGKEIPHEIYEEFKKIEGYDGKSAEEIAIILHELNKIYENDNHKKDIINKKLEAENIELKNRSEIVRDESEVLKKAVSGKIDGKIDNDSYLTKILLNIDSSGFKELLSYINNISGENCNIGYKTEILELIKKLLENLISGFEGYNLSSTVNGNKGNGTGHYANDTFKPLFSKMLEYLEKKDGTTDKLEYFEKINWYETFGLLGDDKKTTEGKATNSLREQIKDEKYVDIFTAINDLGEKIINYKYGNVDLTAISKYLNSFLETQDKIKQEMIETIKRSFKHKDVYVNKKGEIL